MFHKESFNDIHNKQTIFKVNNEKQQQIVQKLTQS